MKKLTLILTAILFAVTGTLAQTPNQFKYQAVLRDASGVIMAEESVTVDISILQTTATGSSVFDETHIVTTTAQGLINLNIGSVEDLSVVDFSADTYFVEISVNSTVMGTSQLLSVPYALQAKNCPSLKAQVEIMQNSMIAVGTMVKDYDGNVYGIVKIGNQIWMAENLRVTRYADGSEIDASNPAPATYTNAEWAALGNNNTDKAYYNTNSDYGALYTYAAATNGDNSGTGVQGICPNGWHLPSDAEWTTLTDELGGTSVAGGKLKETGTTHWNSPNTGATNESGFTALPGGYRHEEYGNFGSDSAYGYFWSATESSSSFYAWYRILYYDYSDVSSDTDYKSHGFSVRCLRD